MFADFRFLEIGPRGDANLASSTKSASVTRHLTPSLTRRNNGNVYHLCVTKPLRLSEVPLQFVKSLGRILLLPDGSQSVRAAWLEIWELVLPPSLSPCHQSDARRRAKLQIREIVAGLNRSSSPVADHRAPTPRCLASDAPQAVPTSIDGAAPRETRNYPPTNRKRRVCPATRRGSALPNELCPSAGTTVWTFRIVPPVVELRPCRSSRCPDRVLEHST